MGNKSKKAEIRMTPEFWVELERAAEEAMMSVSCLLRYAARKYMDDVIQQQPAAAPDGQETQRPASLSPHDLLMSLKKPFKH